RYGGHSYLVRSAVTVPHTAALYRAPGLSDAALKQWRADPLRRNTLQLPDDPQTRARLLGVARDLQEQWKNAGRPLETPYQKLLAINTHLRATCQYSLSSPTVPATEDAVLFFLTHSKRGACDM